jgi:hypothetical protein
LISTCAIAHVIYNITDVVAFRAGLFSDTLIRYISKHPVTTRIDQLLLTIQRHDTHALLHLEVVGRDRTFIPVTATDTLMDWSLQLAQVESLIWSQVDYYQ